MIVRIKIPYLNQPVYLIVFIGDLLSLGIQDRDAISYSIVLIDRLLL